MHVGNRDPGAGRSRRTIESPAGQRLSQELCPLAGDRCDFRHTALPRRWLSEPWGRRRATPAGSSGVRSERTWPVPVTPIDCLEQKAPERSGFRTRRPAKGRHRSVADPGSTAGFGATARSRVRAASRNRRTSPVRRRGFGAGGPPLIFRRAPWLPHGGARTVDARREPEVPGQRSATTRSCNPLLRACSGPDPRSPDSCRRARRG